MLRDGMPGPVARRLREAAENVLVMLAVLVLCCWPVGVVALFALLLQLA